jgi:8-oxo-dGTP pyrophosphatase MutT (NUDIX family)
MDRFTLSAAVYVLLVRDGKVLLLRRYNTGWSDGLYSLPAGHIDGNEPLRQAACREAKEEAGVTVRTEDLAFAHVMHRVSNKEYLDFFFVTNTWEGEPHNAEPEKCDDLSWFPLDGLPENLLPYVRQVIEDYGQGVHFSEVGWE